MTEIKRASRMSTEEIEEVLQKVDWDEVEMKRYYGDYGSSVVIYTDAETTTMEGSTYYRDEDAAGVIGYLECWGRDVDLDDYATDLAEQNDDGEWVVIHDELRASYPDPISQDDMVEISIREGDIDYFAHIDELLEKRSRWLADKAMFSPEV